MRILRQVGALALAAWSTFVVAADVPVLGVVIRASDAGIATKPDSLGKLLFGPTKGVASFWRENTYGDVRMVGTVYPTVLVSDYPLAANRCYLGSIQDARALLTQAGVDLSRYDLLVVVMSGNSHCGSKGVGGRGFVVMNGAIPLGYVAHEVGHALTLSHAGSVRCKSPTNCAVDGYGYHIDPMGKGDAMGSSNVVHKAHLGLLNGRVYEHAAPAGEAVTYTIKPITSPDGMVAVRLGGSTLPANRQTDPATWIEYRQPTGLDAVLAGREYRLMLTRGALILRVGRSCTPCLVDTKPASPDIKDAAVLPGESFVEAGHRIETISATPEGVTVRITKL